MQIKMNKEIRNYTESVFFGLSFRQTVCSVLALITAGILYFICRDKLGTELTSWVCIIGAVPFGVLGFVKYHGMNAEAFIWAWIRSELLEPRYFKSVPYNLYDEAMTEQNTGKDERQIVKDVKQLISKIQSKIKKAVQDNAENIKVHRKNR